MPKAHNDGELSHTISFTDTTGDRVSLAGEKTEERKGWAPSKVMKLHYCPLNWLEEKLWGLDLMIRKTEAQWLTTGHQQEFSSFFPLPTSYSCLTSLLLFPSLLLIWQTLGETSLPQGILRNGQGKDKEASWSPRENWLDFKQNKMFKDIKCLFP